MNGLRIFDEPVVSCLIFATQIDNAAGINIQAHDNLLIHIAILVITYKLICKLMNHCTIYPLHFNYFQN